MTPLHRLVFTLSSKDERMPVPRKPRPYMSRGGFRRKPFGQGIDAANPASWKRAYPRLDPVNTLDDVDRPPYTSAIRRLYSIGLIEVVQRLGIEGQCHIWHGKRSSYSATVRHRKEAASELIGQSWEQFLARGYTPENEWVRNQSAPYAAEVGDVPPIDALEYGFVRPYPNSATLVAIHRLVYAYATETAIHVLKDTFIYQTCGATTCCSFEHLATAERYAPTDKRHIRRHIKTICKNGHVYEEVGVYTAPNGARQCKECRRVYNKRAYDNARLLEQWQEDSDER